ncbi:MAG: lysophospholipase [Lewinellaceae bacterium]|nr:lysophospholipase [Lewinellaceae bacterium]
MEQSFTLQTPDKLTLFGRHWSVDTPRAVVVMVHGLGEHIGRYTHVAELFNGQHYAFMGLDRRGHGKSEGQRGHTPGLDELLAEIDLAIKKAREIYSQLPVFLYGHSQGGNLVLTYLLRHPEKVNGVISTAPWIALAMEPSPVQIWLAKNISKLFPALSQPNGLKTTHLSRDPAVVTAYEADPLVHDRITVKTGAAMIGAAAVLNEYAGPVYCPVYLAHGEADQITSAAASAAFAKRVQGDITYQNWPGLYHEIHNEPEKTEVLGSILSWLAAKMA